MIKCDVFCDTVYMLHSAYCSNATLLKQHLFIVILCRLLYRPTVACFIIFFSCN